MHSTTAFSTLVLAGGSLAQFSTIAVSPSRIAGTAGTGSLATPVASPTNSRLMDVYNVYSIAPTVTPLCSIIAADSQSTTYQMTCARGEACAQFAGPSTVTQGHSGVQYVTAVTHSASAAPSVETLTMSCSVPGSIATCIAKNAETTSTTTLPAWQQIPAMITAGSFKLANSTNPHFGTASAGTGTAVGTGVGTGVAPTSIPITTITSTTSTPTTSSSTVSTGAAAANTPVAAGGLAAAGLLLAGLVL